jgi:hypothetical protein
MVFIQRVLRRLWLCVLEVKVLEDEHAIGIKRLLFKHIILVG